MKLIFFGASKFVIPLIAMLNKNFELSLVVTTERNPLDAVPTYCQQQNIPFVSIKNLQDAKTAIEEKNAEMGVLAYFGLLLPQTLLETFPKGILNVHPSLLPKYRGATPVQSALLNGDHETGVTIIKLDEHMDHGPMLAQEKETISSSDTTETLHDRLFTKGTQLLENLIKPYGENTIELQKQNHDQAIFTKKSFTKQDGYFDSNHPPTPEELDRMIRAYYPWPTVWTRLKMNDKEKIVKFLPEHKLQVEGKNPMSLKDFINGYPQAQTVIKKLFSPTLS
jgi:methionyl-tRNA formyltransferase